MLSQRLGWRKYSILVSLILWLATTQSLALALSLRFTLPLASSAQAFTISVRLTPPRVTIELRASTARMNLNPTPLILQVKVMLEVMAFLMREAPLILVMVTTSLLVLARQRRVLVLIAPFTLLESRTIMAS